MKKKFFNDGNVALPIRLTWFEAASYNYVYIDMVQHPDAVKAFNAEADVPERMAVYSTALRVKNRLDRRPGINKTRLHRLTPVK